MSDLPHISVLPDEVIDVFSSIKNGLIIDCTLGFGGHSELLLKNNPNISVIGNDVDDEAIEFATKRLAIYGDRFSFIKGRFADVISKVDTSKVRGVLADIGVSSFQLDNLERGFSFGSDELDMRMDTGDLLDAKTVINTYSTTKLEQIFFEYGEIREAKKLARAIVEERKKQKFESAVSLAKFIASVLPNQKINPATLAFQAIRIEVNDELGQLQKLLNNIKNSNINNAVIAIISFHSLEDRIVKQTFKEWATSCKCPPHYFKCTCGNNNAVGKILTKTPILPKAIEVKKNRRSRSAKLRVFYMDKGDFHG